MIDLTPLSAADLDMLERSLVRERARRGSGSDPAASEAAQAAVAIAAAFGWHRVAGDDAALRTADGRRVAVRTPALPDRGTFGAIPDPAGNPFELLACVFPRPDGSVEGAVLVTLAEVAARARPGPDGLFELPAAALELGRGVHDITAALARSAAPRPLPARPARLSPRALLRAQLAASLALAAAPQG